MRGFRRAGANRIALILPAVFTAVVAHAGVGISSLRGIDRIKVVVEDLSSAAANPGVTEEGLREQIESHLKKAGIRLAEPDKSPEADSSLVPILYLALTTERTGGAHDFVLRIELLQHVTLARDPAIQASSASTWSTLRFGRAESTDFAKKVRTVLTVMLEDFLADFAAVNPRWQSRMK
jgi:hypothetical protein